MIKIPSECIFLFLWLIVNWLLVEDYSTFVVYAVDVAYSSFPPSFHSMVVLTHCLYSFLPSFCTSTGRSLFKMKFAETFPCVFVPFSFRKVINWLLNTTWWEMIVSATIFYLWQISHSQVYTIFLLFDIYKRS